MFKIKLDLIIPNDLRVSGQRSNSNKFLLFYEISRKVLDEFEIKGGLV